MISIVDDSVQAAGQTLPLADFPATLNRHPRLAQALALETQGQQIIRAPWSQGQLNDFVREVCAWGGYPQTAERVLGGNPWPQLQHRFENAIEALQSDPPHIQFALREICRLRHLGVSFASKHLRLLRPDVCPALDSILSAKLGYALKARDYKRFSRHCLRVAHALQDNKVLNPIQRKDGVPFDQALQSIPSAASHLHCAQAQVGHDVWFAADVEMTLYVFVKTKSAD